MIDAQPYSHVGPDAESIVAGDEVAIIIDGHIVATGIVIDIADDDRVTVNAETEDDPGNGWTEAYRLADLAHIDSPQAEAAAMFGEGV
jgi:hypothetical protein